jgi:hypothetical protein
MIKNWKQFNESRQLDFFEGTPYDIPKLNPRFSDSADVDTKKYNLECKEILSKLS